MFLLYKHIHDSRTQNACHFCIFLLQTEKLQTVIYGIRRLDGWVDLAVRRYALDRVPPREELGENFRLQRERVNVAFISDFKLPNYRI